MALFEDDSVVDDLQALAARVIIMASDFSAERASVVRGLNRASIPTVGVPLFPWDEGYYFTTGNAARALQRYEEWKDWTAQNELVWDCVGLDIEPEARFYQQIMADPRGLVPMLWPRLRDEETPRRARQTYAALVDRIHADGWEVENYQFPLIADERRAGSTLLQRLMGLVDVRTDREVWMQYTSFVGSLGAGLLWSYGPESEAIAVGTTGGGPDVPGHPQFRPLSWDQLVRDLRLARHWTEDLYIHSLEGCVWNGYLTRLRSFEWGAEAKPPGAAAVARALRGVLRGLLRASVHPWRSLAVAGAVGWLLVRSLRQTSRS